MMRDMALLSLLSMSVALSTGCLHHGTRPVDTNRLPQPGGNCTWKTEVSPSQCVYEGTLETRTRDTVDTLRHTNGLFHYEAACGGEVTVCGTTQVCLCL